MFIYCGQYKNCRAKYSKFPAGQQRIWSRSKQRKPKQVVTTRNLERLQRNSTSRPVGQNVTISSRNVYRLKNMKITHTEMKFFGEVTEKIISWNVFYAVRTLLSFHMISKTWWLKLREER